jgi:hypothetical protein
LVLNFPERIGSHQVLSLLCERAFPSLFTLFFSNFRHC